MLSGLVPHGVSETVDSAGDIDGYTSIAVDSTGHPHISARVIMPLDAKACPNYGKTLPAGVDTKICPNCQAIIPAVADFCSECGTSQKQ